MNEIFNDYTKFTIVYIDDVLVFSESIDQHFRHLQIFINIIKQNGLTIRLGHNIYQGMIIPIERSIEFANKFPNQILDKTQLQRFLGCLNYVGEFVPYLNNIVKALHDRLKKNPPEWTDSHTQIVKKIKHQVLSIKCLYLPNPQAFKIVETDASNIGYGGILKQRVSTQEQIISYTSKHWNSAQQKYLIVKKEVLAIVLCVSKFQSDLLNQRFVVRVDYKSAKDILQKDVKNLASKQIFARWQAILSVFDFEIQYLKGTSNSLPDYLTRYAFLGKHFLLKRRKRKRKRIQIGSPRTIPEKRDQQHHLLGHPPNLGHLPRKQNNKKNIASELDKKSEINIKALIQKARDSKIVYNTQKEKQILTSAPLTNKAPNTYIYKIKFSNVLHIEHEFWDKNPDKAISKAFPSDFQFQPTAKNKTRIFYEFILIDSNSISIKHFKDPKNPLLNTHSTVQILKVLQPRPFGTNLNEYTKFSQSFDPIGYTYRDYIDAWTKVLWHQNINNKHSWLVYFKTNTEYNFLNWFISWWTQFGPIPEILPKQVQQGFTQFTKLYNFEESRIPVDLKYLSNFALAWIFSWQYRYQKTKSRQTLSIIIETFLCQMLEALLAGSKSKEHLTKNLKEVLKMLYSQEEAESSSKTEQANSLTTTSSDVFYQNEDYCFGINLNGD
ncbi:Orf V, partial [Mucuna pruriens]